MTENRPLTPALMADYSDMAVETRLIHADRRHDPDRPVVNPPVVRASTVLHDSVEDMHRRCESERLMRDDLPSYATHGTSTHRAFYDALLSLEGERAAGAWAFPSGLAACTAPLLALLKAGDHALFVDSIYGPTREFAECVLRRFGVDVEFFPASAAGALDKYFRAETALVMMETPGSHSFELLDVPAVAELCQARGIATAIDNTWATPLYFKPLDVGVDMVIHAATKYIAGHSDLTMGVVICNEKVWPKVYRTVTQFGLTTSADEVYLALRGLRTMSVRLERAQKSTRTIVNWLLKRDEVERVLWPALETDPSHAIWKRDFKGASSLFAVCLKPEYEGRLAPFIDALRLFGRGYSWGGCESLLIESYGKRDGAAPPFSRMLRVAVGLEDPQDLIADLERGFAALH